MRVLITATLLWLLGSSAALQAQEATPPANFKAGEHYIELATPAPTQDPAKIEVAELFWYGCGHCFQFEPVLEEWKKDLAEDVSFREVPALFGGVWNTHAQLFYTVQSLGKLEETHEAIFNAIHIEKKQLANEAEMVEFLEPYGISEEQFEKAWSSFGVRSKLAEAGRLAKAYRATGVPTLIVNGKYRIEGGMVGGFESMLEVADFLVARERQAL
ncbi:thiol:disulfide interchange protein DsbA/DsbL [Halopseudomonas sp.]|uniref:thiol:disulfide interchange protein DsbA/DsbL n=1 Tax=Halopseudomonas sp. TaxID=2901191 RepID=UPI0035690809